MRISSISLHSRISTPTPTTLHSPRHLTRKVLRNVRDIANRITVGQKVPPACAVAVVVEPGAEDEVGGDGEEEAVAPLIHTTAKLKKVGAHMMKNHPKKPQ
jgi:hypothetical protein